MAFPSTGQATSKYSRSMTFVSLATRPLATLLIHFVLPLGGGIRTYRGCHINHRSTVISKQCSNDGKCVALFSGQHQRFRVLGKRFRPLEHDPRAHRFLWCNFPERLVLKLKVSVTGSSNCFRNPTAFHTRFDLPAFMAYIDEDLLKKYDRKIWQINFTCCSFCE